MVGVAGGAETEIIKGLRENFNGEYSKVGMYLAIARVAHREGYPYDHYEPPDYLYYLKPEHLLSTAIIPCIRRGRGMGAG